MDTIFAIISLVASVIPIYLDNIPSWPAFVVIVAFAFIAPFLNRRHPTRRHIFRPQIILPGYFFMTLISLVLYSLLGVALYHLAPDLYEIPSFRQEGVTKLLLDLIMTIGVYMPLAFFISSLIFGLFRPKQAVAFFAVGVIGGFLVLTTFVVPALYLSCMIWSECI